MDSHDFYKGSNIRHRGLFSYLLVAVVGAVVGGMLILSFAPAALLEKTIPEEDIKQGGYEPPDQMAIVPEKVEISVATLAAKRVAPAVVGIRVSRHKDDMSVKGLNMEDTGTGVIVDKSGYILTDYNISGSMPSNTTVYLSDGRDVPATVVWKDPELGISILKIETGDLIFAELGSTDSLETGETAIVIGKSSGLSFQPSVARGIVSAASRTIPVDEDRFIEDLIEIDMPINKSLSGGPLVNSEGRVIGINTASVKGTDGMGYAIPVNTVVPVIKKLVEAGYFKAPHIGITGFNKEIANFHGDRIEKGILVADIERKGPFFEAGIRKGDIILEVNDIPVNKVASLKQHIFSQDAGSSVKIKYQDMSGDAKIVPVTIRPVEDEER